MTYRQLALIILQLKDNQLDSEVIVHEPEDDHYFKLAEYPMMKACVDHDTLAENQIFLTLRD